MAVEQALRFASVLPALDHLRRPFSLRRQFSTLRKRRWPKTSTSAAYKSRKTHHTLARRRSDKTNGHLPRSRPVLVAAPRKCIARRIRLAHVTTHMYVRFVVDYFQRLRVKQHRRRYSRASAVKILRCECPPLTKETPIPRQRQKRKLAEVIREFLVATSPRNLCVRGKKTRIPLQICRA